MSKDVFDYQTQNTFSVRIASTDDTYESFEKVFEVHVSSTLSADAKLADGISFALYPNPSSDFVQISSTAIGSNSVAVQIFDLSGKVLHNYEGQLQEINSRLSEDSRGLDKGVYFVRIDVAGQSVTKKFIKL